MGAPIGICIVIASFSTMMLVLPFDISMFATAQKMFSSLDSFALLAVPFFVLSGVIMNSGGIAARLVNFAKLFTGKLPGSLSYTNIVGNMMFGAISGSAIAASTSIGGVMVPMSAREGYDRGFAAAVNIASAPTGMLIPPTTAFILYALASGEHRLPLCSPAVWLRVCCGALAVCWSRWWSLSVEIIGFSSPSKKAWR